MDPKDGAIHEALLDLAREVGGLSVRVETQGHHMGIELRDIKEDVRRINGSIASAHVRIAEMQTAADLHHPDGWTPPLSTKTTTTTTVESTPVTIGLLWKLAGAMSAGAGLVLGGLKLAGKL